MHAKVISFRFSFPLSWPARLSFLPEQSALVTSSSDVSTNLYYCTRLLSVAYHIHGKAQNVVSISSIRYNITSQHRHIRDNFQRL